jgi:hypothetical protein
MFANKKDNAELKVIDFGLSRKLQPQNQAKSF